MREIYQVIYIDVQGNAWTIKAGHVLSIDSSFWSHLNLIDESASNHTSFVSRNVLIFCSHHMYWALTVWLSWHVGTLVGLLCIRSFRWGICALRLVHACGKRFVRVRFRLKDLFPLTFSCNWSGLLVTYLLMLKKKISWGIFKHVIFDKV